MQNDDKKPKPQTTRHRQALVSSIAEVREFIMWARSIGLKRAKLGDVEFELSDITIAVDAEAKAQRAPEERDTSKTMTDTLPINEQDENEDLFWSSN